MATSSSSSSSSSSSGSDTSPSSGNENRAEIPVGRPKLRRKAIEMDDMTATQRLVEYVAIVSSKPRWETEPVAETPQEDDDEIVTTENIRMPEATKEKYTFEPKITARYPLSDYPDNPLNPMILQFCYPSSDIIVPKSTYEMPKIHHFVLTQGCGRKLYATCLTILEEYDCDEKTLMTMSCSNGFELDSQSNETLYLPKVICLLSTWPYLTAFREYLSQLYRLASTTNVMKAPLERYVLNICKEIPAPPPGAYEINLHILDSRIRFWAPPAKLPIAYTALPFHTLFECLDLDNLLLVWKALTLERKILIVSSQCSMLTICSEILCSLLFPFRWSHLYVPLLPRMLCPMLDAPVPYLVGVVRENFAYAQQHVNAETMVVDLDVNTVTMGPEFPPLPDAPSRKWNKLVHSLTETIGDMFWRARGQDEEYLARKKTHTLDELSPLNTQRWKEKLTKFDHAFNLAYTPESPNLSDSLVNDQNRMDRVQETFLRFFVALLKDHRKFLKLPTNDRPSFDHSGFLSSLKYDSVPFVSELCQTQQFDDFLTRRMYSPGEPDLKFFDQSIDAKKNRSKLKIKKLNTPMLQSAKVHKELTRLDAVTPNEDGLSPFAGEAPPEPYVYKRLPETFNESLFCDPRPIPKMISAEFDRQALLVSKLRSEIVDGEDDHELMEFYGGDYDKSPEVASFTVFLFVYSSLVGREWQKYSRKRKAEEAQRGPPSEKSFHGSDEPPQSTNEQMCSGGGCSAEDLFLQDLTIGCCDSCPNDSLSSTFSYLQAGVSGAYQSLFGSPNECSDFFCQDDLRPGIPKSAAAAAEYEEAREVAAAQLEVAFETLDTMSLRGLSVDSDAYLSLMQACGRCGDKEKALKLIEIMKKDGFVAGGEVLTYFLEAFASEGVQGQDVSKENEEVADAYALFLKKGLDSAKDLKLSSSPWLDSGPPDPVSTDGVSEDESEFSDGSSTRSSIVSSSFLDWIHQHPYDRKKRRRRKRMWRKSKGKKLLVTDMLSRHFALGESLLDFIYPNLAINTDWDSCPQCSYSLTEDDVVSGWNPCAFQDYNTKCPKCHHRFIPRFEVRTSAPDFEGSQGLHTPLYCEILSPWVLRKEFQKIIKDEKGIERIMHPQWRSGAGIRATLFWNFVVQCRRNRLPFTFLLQGNFQNRVILPRQPDEM